MLDPTTDADPNAESTDGYSLLQTLSPGRTFLCTDVSSNIVVLKKLDEDCLHRRQLHPSIKERLARVRDLPHARLATLRSVERWGGSDLPCLVWTWLDGETWDETIAKSPEDFGILASQLVESVDALHKMGIVHGCLHGRNIIVRPDRQVWLSDVSPYLYTDPEADITGIIALLDASLEHLPEPAAMQLSHALDDFQTGQIESREFSHALRGLMNEQAEAELASEEEPNTYRRSSLVWAVVITIFAIALGARLYLFYRPSSQAPTTFPSLRMKLGASSE